MRRPSLLATLVLVASVAGCGSADEFGSSTMPDWEPPLTQSGTTTTSPAPPLTRAPVTADLNDPDTWIGHHVRESNLAAPFAEVTLDGTSTGWITAMTGCGMIDAVNPPTVCPMFVREDPGGYGHSEFEPGAWVLLSWQVGDQGYGDGGIVFDAVAFETTEPDLRPIAQCRRADGGSGVVAGLLRYDPTYVPTGDAERDNAAHPLVRAWSIDQGNQLGEVPVTEVRCEPYEYGD